MKSGRGLWAVVGFLVLLCSCATNHPPQDMQRHGALPEEFELVYSSSWGGFTSLTLINGYLVRKSLHYEFGGTVRKTKRPEYFTPSQADWIEFWKRVEKFKVWAWRKRYSPSDIGVTVFDGGGWSLRIRHQGRELESGGENAGPKPGRPQTTISVGDEGYGEELEALVEPLLVKAQKN